MSSESLIFLLLTDYHPVLSLSAPHFHLTPSKSVESQLKQPTPLESSLYQFDLAAVQRNPGLKKECDKSPYGKYNYDNYVQNSVLLIQ